MTTVRMLNTRGARRVAGGAACVAGMLFALSGAASAAAAGPASCIGHEASSISPPGSSDELPGGMPQLRAAIAAESPGVPPGSVYRFIARLHEGSHEGCDEALE